VTLTSLPLSLAPSFYLLIMRTDSKRNSKKNAVNMVFVALFSLILGYGFGNLACASSWLTSAEAAYSFSFAPRKVEVVDPDYPNDREAHYSSSRRQIIGTNDRRSIQRTSLPYDCGVVFFYHIPSTGGSSINHWFLKYIEPPLGTLPNTSYYEEWNQAVRKDGSFHPHPRQVERRFAKGMAKHIQNLGPHEWRIAHSHSLSNYLNESEDLLYKWRSDVEAQGCQLINTVMFRDPLNHAMSLWKIVNHKNATTEKWLQYLKSPTENGKWATVLDFFLYNIHGLRHHGDYPNGPGGRNPFNVTKEIKVKRALELLHRHFDIVTIDHPTFVDKLLDMTGWPRIRMPNRNRYLKELTFFKTEIQALQKLLELNGDLDFIDQVKYEYNGYLSYVND